jgi:hypothetical protein
MIRRPQAGELQDRPAIAALREAGELAADVTREPRAAMATLGRAAWYFHLLPLLCGAVVAAVPAFRGNPLAWVVLLSLPPLMICRHRPQRRPHLHLEDTTAMHRALLSGRDPR